MISVIAQTSFDQLPLSCTIFPVITSAENDCRSRFTQVQASPLDIERPAVFWRQRLERLENSYFKKRLAVDSAHYCMIAVPRLYHPVCKQLGRHAGDTGIAYHYRIIRHTEIPGYFPGRASRSQICPVQGFRRSEFLHIRLCGT